eukprot:22842-Lingulodinium_polyedra.AAC.1
MNKSEPRSWETSGMCVHRNFMRCMASRGFCLPNVKTHGTWPPRERRTRGNLGGHRARHR